MGLVNIQMTNFDNGVNNRNAADLFGSMAQLDPTRFHNYMEDFDYFTAADWAITGAGAGTQFLVGGQGGILALTTAGADNDAEFLTRTQAFRFDAGFPSYFRSRLSIDDAVESDLIVGLTGASGLLPANGMFFDKDDGSAALNIRSRRAGATIAEALDIFTVVGDEFFTCEFYYDGSSRVYYGVNGNPLGFLDLLVGGNSMVPQFNQAISFGVQAGQAAVLVGNFDYIYGSQERTGVTEP